jgi:hypothetical protein
VRSNSAARPVRHYTAPHWPWSALSVETAARQREVERTELTEGGNTRIYGDMQAQEIWFGPRRRCGDPGSCPFTQ